MTTKNAIGAVVLIAPLMAIGCTNTSSLTAPSGLGASSGAALVATEKAGQQKVTLHFHDTDDGVTSPPVDVVGMAIDVQASVPASAMVYHAVTGKQGDAIFWIPASVRQIKVTTGTCATHYNPETRALETEEFVSETVYVDLPANTREGWITVHETVPNVYGCALP